MFRFIFSFTFACLFVRSSRRGLGCLLYNVSCLLNNLSRPLCNLVSHFLLVYHLELPCLLDN